MSAYLNLPEIKTLETIFLEYTNLSEYEINELVKISYKGYPILDLYKRYGFVYEVLGLLQEYSFEKVYNFLVKISDMDIDINGSTIYQFSKFDKLRSEYEADISRIRDEAEIKEGDTPCKRCNSKRVIYTSKQTRSGDEPETLFFACNDCGYTWRE